MEFGATTVTPWLDATSGEGETPGYPWLPSQIVAAQAIDASTPPRRAALLVHGADDVERLVKLQETRWVLGETRTQTWRV